MLNLYYTKKKVFNFFLLNFIRKSFKHYYNSLLFFGCYKWNESKKYRYIDKSNFTIFPRILKPSGYWYRMQSDFYTLKIYFMNSWKFYRHFFGYTVYGNTRTNSVSIKNASKRMKRIMIKYVFKNKFKKFNGSNKLLVMHIEILNRIWFYQWRYEWRRSFVKYTELLQNTRKRLKFGVYFSKKNKALNFIQRPQKKK